MNAMNIKRNLLIACIALCVAAPWTLFAQDAPATETEKEEPTFASYAEELVYREAEYQALIEEIKRVAPRYAALQYPEPLGYEEVQERLITRPDQAIVEFMLGEESAFVWFLSKSETEHAREDGTMTNEEFEVFRLDLEKINATARKYRELLSDPASSGYKELGAELHKLVLGEVEPLMKGKKDILVVPDGILYYIPFESLVDSNGDYLIENYNLTYAPSASVMDEINKDLRRAKERRKQSKSTRIALLAIGDPVFSVDEINADGTVMRGDAAKDSDDEAAAEGEDTTDIEAITTRGLYEDQGYAFPRLPYTGVEVEEIASIFKNRPTEVLERLAAQESSLKAKDLTNYQIIHFATHGVLDEKFPQRSGVVLSLVDESGKKLTAADSDEDGFLQMQEIFGLRLDADLVSLSACQTGLGKLVRGEGMVGLTRAFLYAGTPTVLVSLWSVNDLTTAYLMKDFYKNLEGGMSKSAALRTAQRGMAAKKINITDFKQRVRDREAAERGVGGIAPAKKIKGTAKVDASHPYYWAAFVLIGSGE